MGSPFALSVDDFKVWAPLYQLMNLRYGLLHLMINLTFSGKVPSPICGQTVILAEKCEENTYTLIEPSIDQQNVSPVKNGKKQPKDIETSEYLLLA